MAGELSKSEEIQRRIDRVVVLIGQGKTFGEIKRTLRNEFGIKHRQASRYVAKARERIVAGVNKTPRDFISEQIAALHAIAADPETSANAKIRIHLGLLKLVAPRAVSVELLGPDDIEDDPEDVPGDPLVAAQILDTLEAQDPKLVESLRLITGDGDFVTGPNGDEGDGGAVEVRAPLDGARSSIDEGDSRAG